MVWCCKASVIERGDGDCCVGDGDGGGVGGACGDGDCHDGDDGDSMDCRGGFWRWHGHRLPKHPGVSSQPKVWAAHSIGSVQSSPSDANATCTKV